jgi:hypothetical protein
MAVLVTMVYLGWRYNGKVLEAMASPLVQNMVLIYLMAIYITLGLRYGFGSSPQFTAVEPNPLNGPDCNQTPPPQTKFE